MRVYNRNSLKVPKLCELYFLRSNEGGSTVTNKELYTKANEAEQKVVAHIADDQWDLAMP
jgi:hypothetical protein